WWLSETNGLRIGTSVNSLGNKRLSEISEISGSELPNMLREVDKYISGSIRNVDNERIKHSSFYL
ncbi:MAG: hypothetical protein ACU84H_15865, partial [Gammaproteobacteria bacterium]